MTPKEFKKLVAEIQSAQSESDTVEVKTAQGGTPKRLYAVLSAFANRTGGASFYSAWMSPQIFQ